MRRVLALLGCGLLAACGATSINLDDFARPFACDHNGGDGGKQCANGWSCGFDDRCFQQDLVLDGGQFVEQWKCAIKLHCPNGWLCGQEVEATRNCQQEGVGTASRCLNDDGGCQGGWRCGAGNRCFNPRDLDGGTMRDCTADPQCPNDFRCGELVAGQPRRCIKLRVGATSPCLTDRGCEGTFRCDTFNQRCVEVTDVITAGQTSMISARELNPRIHEPTPLLFAMTRNSGVSTAFAGTGMVIPKEGVLMASILADGGLRVAAQLRETGPGPTDGGALQMLFERTYALKVPTADVTDLALSGEGPAVRYRDGGTERLRLSNGGWDFVFRTDFLRQSDPLELTGVPPLPTRLVWVNGGTVEVDGLGPVVFDAGVREVIAGRDTLHVLMGNSRIGRFDGGQVDEPFLGTSGALPEGLSRGAVAGYLGPPGPNPFLGVVLELPNDAGATGLVSLSSGPMGWFANPVVAACPDRASPLQLGFDLDTGQRILLLARCPLPDGGSFPVQVIARQGMTEYQGLNEDQIPFQRGLIAQRSGPFVRAHAGPDGRVWQAEDPDGRALLGRLPLRPMVLDRQPETMISFFTGPGQGVRLLAVAAGHMFNADSNGGFISELRGADVVPLTFLPGRNWVVATNGLLSLEGTKPRQLATMPASSTFAPPASAAAIQLQLAGRTRDVVLVSSGDTIWVADVTEAQSGPFAQPAVFERVLVPVPGVRLRSMTLVSSTLTGISGYLTTGTDNVSFGTADLVGWTLKPVQKPAAISARPLEVWTEPDGGAGRTGFTDGTVWSLPIMVPLTQPLSTDGGVLVASDFARKCGDVFAATTEGIFRAERSSVPDGGLPSWVRLTLPIALDSTESLRLFETHDTIDRLFVGTQTGQVLELTSACP